SEPSLFRNVALPLLIYAVIWFGVLAIAFSQSQNPHMNPNFNPAIMVPLGVGVIPLTLATPLLVWRWLAKRRGQSMFTLLWDSAVLRRIRNEPIAGHAAVVCFGFAILTHSLPWIHG